MQRRNFIRNSFLTGAATLTAGPLFSNWKTKTGRSENKPFNLDYAFHDGMFKNNGGEDFLDQGNLRVLNNIVIKGYDKFPESHKKEILRIFKSIEEQNNWFSSADHPAMAPYLSTKVLQNNSPFISAPMGFGKMNKTGRVNIELLLADYKRELEDEQLLLHSTLDYSKIDFKGGEVGYGNILAKRIIFCEGFGLMQNPFFNYLPMQGLKGEVITIKAPELNLEQLLKSGVFVMPLGEDLYKVGATFNWQDKTNEVTVAGKMELEEKVKEFIKIPFDIVDQKAGVRPTVADRRPLLGKHPKHPELVVFNGLGTRGVMISPLLSAQLIDHLEADIPLAQEVDINRFKKRFIA